MALDKPSPFAPPGVRRGERERVVAGQQLVANRLADGVPHAGIDDLPGPHRLEVKLPACLFFGHERGRDGLKRILEGIGVVAWIGHHVDPRDGVGNAVEVEVEAHVEEMLMIWRIELGGDEDAEVGISPGG